MRVKALTLAIALLGCAAAATATPPSSIAEADLPTLIIAANEGLRAQGMDYLIEGVEFLSAGKARTSIQLHRLDYGWVVGDPRRADAQLPGLTWAMDRTWMDGSSYGGSFTTLERSVYRAGTAWNQATCVGTRALVGVHPPEADLTLFDYLFGRGQLGSALRADIVMGGFRPDLQAVFGDTTIAFTVTFVFVDGRGEVTDIDGDGRMDTAASEIYLNETTPWSFGTGAATGTYDLTTVLLHELGHALGLPHFGAPPVASMNPSYHGLFSNTSPTDIAALCSQYAGTGIYTHGSPPEEGAVDASGSRLD
jgi:hypothetical protein